MIILSGHFIPKGLRVGDEIVEFGSVNTENFQNLQNIASVVQHSEGVSHWHSCIYGSAIKLILLILIWHF